MKDIRINKFRKEIRVEMRIERERRYIFLNAYKLFEGRGRFYMLFYNSSYYLEFIFTSIRNSNISRYRSEYYLLSGSIISEIDLSRHSCPFFNPFNLFPESSLQRGRSYNVKLTIILFSLLYNLFAY